jgi:resuscitation-promoting factor RpfB
MATTSIRDVKAKANTFAISPDLMRWIVAVVGLLAMWLLWHTTSRTLQVSVDGVVVSVNTHRRTVRELLVDLGVDLHPNDHISPAPDMPLSQAQGLVVERARPVQIVVDGRTIQSATFGPTPRTLLEDAGVLIDAYDQVLVGDKPLGLDDPLPPRMQVVTRSRFAPVRPWARTEAESLQVRVIRAVPIVVDDVGLPFVIRTTASTIGEALRQAQITIYLGDHVVPSLGSAVSTGLRVSIERTVPVTLNADGRMIKTRTRGDTVADALAEMKIGVAGMDRVEPALETKLYDNIKIAVTRVHDDIEVAEQIVPFDTVFVADANLPIDTQQVVNSGAEGVTRTRYRVRYENDQETSRVLEDTWVAQEPAERQIAYGQQITPQTITTADGRQITYWRHILMYASSYSASTAGVAADESYYGQTYTGDRMRFGVVAVDPAVIPLHSQVYVADYGVGDALDTGGAIRARRIDLGYDDSNLIMWNRWVDVYLLWPPPPAYQITWVLPNWPRAPE